MGTSSKEANSRDELGRIINYNTNTSNQQKNVTYFKHIYWDRHTINIRPISISLSFLLNNIALDLGPTITARRPP
jgi:hypothetical protein